MAELHQIIGSVLRDVAQARMASDVYSRNISNYYEQDPLLRRFPTPRTEIDEVEFELKFVLDGLQSNQAQNEEREVSAASLFTNFSFALSESFFDALNDHTKDIYDDLEPETQRRLRSNDPTQASGWAQFEYRIYVKQSLVLYFQRNRDRLIQNATLQVDTATTEIKDLLKNWIKKILEDPNLSEEKLEVIQKKVISALNLKDKVEQLKDPVLQIEDLQGDLKLNVEVTLDKLMETPAPAISSIKIKSKVRNYLWAKIEHEGQTQRRLTPE